MRHLTVLLATLSLLALLVAPASAAPLLDDAAALADEDCGSDLLDLPQPPPPFALAGTPCPGIRPGALHSVEGAGCTFNFVFRGTSYDEDGNPVDEGLFIGTAGHCVFDEASPSTVFAEGEGREVADRSGKRMGQVVFGVDEGLLDFALIKIDEDRYDDVNPAMCHFGGPVALGGDVSVGTPVQHFGGGLGFGSTVPGRTGVATGYSSDRSVLHYTGFALYGDSGSGVIDGSGNAVGVLVRLSTSGRGNTDATDLGFHLDLASQALDIDFELQTAPLAP